MNKKLLIAFVSILSLTGLAFAQSNLSVMTVDMGELYEKYHVAKAARDELQFNEQTAEDELNQMLEKVNEIRDTAQGIQAELTDSASPLNEDARQAKQKQLVELQRQFNAAQQEALQYRQEQQQVLAQRRQSIMQTQFNDIRQVVIEVAQDRGANLVLNVGNTSAAVLYTADEFDATEAVLEILNQDAPEE